MIYYREVDRVQLMGPIWPMNVFFIVLNGYISNGYISTYIIFSVLLLGQQSLKYLLSGLQRKSLLTPDSGFLCILLKTADFVSLNSYLG